jgi:dGTPase
MSPLIQKATDRLREFLFEHVYVGSDAKREETKAKHIVQKLFYYFSEHNEALPEEYLLKLREGHPQRIICDYIAGMTDRFAIRFYQKTFLPLPWEE